MKTKGHIFVLLAFLIVSGMIVSPVCAANTTIKTTGYFESVTSEVELENVYNYAYSSNSSRAIAQIQFRAPKGTILNYTITYGAGESLSGYVSYVAGAVDVLGYGEGVTTINIGSSTDSRSFVDTGLLRKWEIVGYAREEIVDTQEVVSTGYAIYDVSLGLGNIGFQSGFIAYEPVADLQPIESISFTSNEPVKVQIFTAEREELQSNISKTYLDTANEWVQFALSIAGALLGFVIAIFAWIKFLFIDNLLLVVALYLAVSMAYSAASSRNIFQFYKKFFRFQRSMFDFMVQMWNYLIQIVSSFRGIFRI